MDAEPGRGAGIDRPCDRFRHIVGGVSRSGPPFWEPLQQAFADHAGLPFAAACRIVPGLLGDTAGLLGAAAFVLVPDRYGWDPGH